MHKDPTNYSLLTYAWVLLLSIWGGTAHTIRKIRTGALKRFSFSEWIGDIVISGFLGVITFYLCEYANIVQPLSAALVGIAAHQGTRGISALETYIAKKIGVRLDG
ncbi:phage holin family protein [Nitratiruptor sp. SB155-2]|uniref:phage holin family protein n=1 Tax=Nitratiruptor sp. (strain SB155-2) TaxID=387092 RepID=UPI0001586F73|nr:phage holin family protein [Nitratiruptor sp. SB155-2]BAF69596.1 phage-related protein [Nitratiruptor sp. SB155-2]BAN05359.1 holin [Nitratiruptor phage NrS-1]